MSLKPIDTNFSLTNLRAENKDNKPSKKKVDILHDTPVRYAGYCDDIGATIRVLCTNSGNALIKKLPVISYIPAGAYIGADVANTYSKAKNTEGKKTAAKKAAAQGVFQVVTSILFPIAIVAGAQKVAGKVFDKIPALANQITADGSKIVNRKRDVALALAGLGTLLGVSGVVDSFSEKIIKGKIINPALKIDE